MPQSHVDTVAARPVVLQQEATSQATMHVEIPQTQYIDQVVAVDTPVVMHQQVPQVQTVLATVDVPLVQSIGNVPAVMRRQVPQFQTARTTG